MGWVVVFSERLKKGHFRFPKLATWKCSGFTENDKYTSKYAVRPVPLTKLAEQSSPLVIVSSGFGKSWLVLTRQLSVSVVSRATRKRIRKLRYIFFPDQTLPLSDDVQHVYIHTYIRIKSNKQYFLLPVSVLFRSTLTASQSVHFTSAIYGLFWAFVRCVILSWSPLQWQQASVTASPPVLSYTDICTDTLSYTIACFLIHCVLVITWKEHW